MSRQIETRRFDARLAEPLATADGRIDARSGWLVAVRADGETLGVGEATPLAGWTESMDACGHALAAASDGEAAGARSTPAASHGLSLAATDALARRRGESLAALLARGDPAERVAVNATIGDQSADETVTAAERAVESGYRTLKLKIGGRSVAEDLDRVRRVAETVPETVSVRVDANGAYDRQTARRVVAGLEGTVEYVEQPVAGEDLAGLADLRGVGAPVAADESLRAAGPWRVVAADAADVLVCKPMALGGPARTAALSRAAAARGVATVVTTTIDAVIARTAAVAVAAAVPSVGRQSLAHGLATGDRLAREPTGGDGEPLPDPVPVTDGEIAVPAGPGLAGDSLDWL